MNASARPTGKLASWQAGKKRVRDAFARPTGKLASWQAGKNVCVRDAFARPTGKLADSRSGQLASWPTSQLADSSPLASDGVALDG